MRGRDLRPLRSTVQGRFGGVGQCGQGRPGPHDRQLLDDYGDLEELAAACAGFEAMVNARAHAETRGPPADMLVEERARVRVLPAERFVAALGEPRVVRDDQTIRFGSVRDSLPKAWVGQQVWCRVAGEELVVVGRAEGCLVEVWRHGCLPPAIQWCSTSITPIITAATNPHPAAASQRRRGANVSGPRRRGGTLAA